MRKTEQTVRGMNLLSQTAPSRDARLPHADVTNAPHLFGDPDDFGDIEDGDIDDYGDVDEFGDPEDMYGDPAMLAYYAMVSGDPSTNRLQARKLAKSAGYVAAGAASGLLARRAMGAVKRKLAARKLAKLRLSRAANALTIRRQGTLRSNVGKISRRSMLPFFSLLGAKMNSSPIDPLSKFVADMFKVMLDRQNSDTPFLQETAQGVFFAGTWTCTAVGTLASRFYTGLILQIGTNALNASPGTIINITATLPTINGPLVIAATPFLITYEDKFNVRFLFFPWQLVTNKPLPVLGQYNNANPIVVAITGIPAASAVSLVVPGSQHPWTVGMRNGLIQ